MLRQIEWRQQNGPITKSGVLPLNIFFLKKNIIPVLEPFQKIKVKFVVTTTQMFIFVFFVSA